MGLYEEIAAALGMLGGELGADAAVITWQVTGNAQFTIFPNIAENQYPLRAGGFSWAFDFRFTAAAQQFLDAAQIADVNSLAKAMANTQFSYLGAVYKIVSVRIYSGGQMIEVTANALNQGA